jgi:hypothetical protein
MVYRPVGTPRPGHKHLINGSKQRPPLLDIHRNKRKTIGRCFLCGKTNKTALVLKQQRGSYNEITENVEVEIHAFKIAAQNCTDIH